MIQCNSFELVYLRKIPYLIPYGQQTANLQKSVRLNETGVLIWNGLSQKKPLDRILQDILNTYELSESDRPFVQEYKPYFLSSMIPFMERGGVYVHAVLRGGGEYGEQWHVAGTKLRRIRTAASGSMTSPSALRAVQVLPSI